MAERKYIGKALSLRDGIVFCSNSNLLFGTKVFYNENHEVSSVFIPVPLLEHNQRIEVTDSFDFNFDKRKLIIPLGVLILFLAILTKNFAIIMAAFFFITTGLTNLIDFALVLYIFKRKSSKFYPTSMFHSAEHMAINAYQKHQRIPTLEEVKKASRYSMDCGYARLLTMLFVELTMTLLLAFSALISSHIYFTLTMLTIIFLVTSRKHELPKYLEFFFLSDPTDEQLELAIEGLKKFEENEKIIKDMEASMSEAFSNAIPILLKIFADAEDPFWDYDDCIEESKEAEEIDT